MAGPLSAITAMELKLYKLKNISNKRAHGVDFQVGGGGELM